MCVHPLGHVPGSGLGWAAVAVPHYHSAASASTRCYAGVPPRVLKPSAGTCQRAGARGECSAVSPVLLPIPVSVRVPVPVPVHLPHWRGCRCRCCSRVLPVRGSSRAHGGHLGGGVGWSGAEPYGRAGHWCPRSSHPPRRRPQPRPPGARGPRPAGTSRRCSIPPVRPHPCPVPVPVPAAARRPVRTMAAAEAGGAAAAAGARRGPGKERS